MVKAALKNPYAVIVMVLAILVIGLTAIFHIPTDILPQFKTPAVQVLTLYPGMPAEVMEKDLTSRIERWTGQANGVARQESKSMVGVSVVRDYFSEGTDPNAAMAQVTSLAMSDLYYLPPGTIPPMIMPLDPTASIPLCLIAVSSPTFDETKLYDVAYYQLRNRLQGISGVVAPAVFGGKLRRILAYVDPQKAQAHGLSPLDVMSAIQKANTMIPTGDAKFGSLDYQINANGMVGTVAEMNQIPITIGNGPPTYVGDVADVQDSHQIQQNIVHINGKRQVYIPIYRQPGANTIAVVDGIKKFIKPILERIPGINLDVVMDQSVYVRQAIRNLTNEAIIGFLLAAAMVFIFLRSYRPTFIVILALPLAVLGSLIGLYFTHQTLNVMTLGGLALVIGLLIDESIVVLENTNRHLAMGKTPFEAARDGASEVTRPLTIVTVTISVVFFPIIFLSGMGKFLFTPLALSVIFAIVTSRLFATTLVPVCAAKFLKSRQRRSADLQSAVSQVSNLRGAEQTEAPPENQASGKSEPSQENSTPSRLQIGDTAGSKPALHAEDDDGWFAGLRRTYVRLLQWVLRFRWLVLAGVAALFVVSMLLFRFIGTEMFPRVDAAQFMIRLRATPGLRIELTEELTTRIENYIRQTIPENERKMIIANMGVLYDWPAAYTPNSGSQDAFILVQLQPAHKTSVFAYVKELRRKLPTEFPGTEFNFDTGGMLAAALNGGLPSPIDIQIEGNSLEVAHGIAEKIRNFAQTVPGAVDARIEQRLDAPQISVDVDRVKAAQLGLTEETVVKNIVTAFNSSINFAPSFWVDNNNGNHYFIGAQYPETDIKSLDTLLDIPITDKSQPVPIPLRNVAKVGLATAPVEINHRNITRVTDVFVNVQGRDVGSVAATIQKYLDSAKRSAEKSEASSKNQPLGKPETPLEKSTSSRLQIGDIADYKPALQPLEIPEGYFIHTRGEVQAMHESFQSMGFGFLLAIVLVYLVMVFQFRSFRDPFIVMFAVPLGLVGVAWMLFLTGTNLDIQSVMGCIMMVGIVVSFSVLLVEFTNHLRAEAREKGVQKSAIEAVVEAAGIRLRPILMTGLAAILGLTPMAIAGGANIPLARAVIGGVLSAMVMVLFVVPILYLLLNREPSVKTEVAV